MNKADALLAALRQHATGKTAVRPAAAQGVKTAHEGKDEVDQFRNQLRMVAQEARQPVKSEAPPKVDAKRPQPEVIKAFDAPEQATETVDPKTTRPKGRTDDKDEPASGHAGGESAAAPAPEWHAPDAVLSSVMARLDQAQNHNQAPAPNPAPPQPDDRPVMPARVALPQGTLDRLEVTAKAGEPPKDVPKLDAAPKADATPVRSFSSQVEAAASDAQPLPPVKAVVREQETHFEPVQQPGLLQKVVDRLATDLQSTASAQPASAAPDVAVPEAPRAADKPVRILTLQLEPPSIGSVTVRMRMAGDAVEVHLSAERAETTEMLRQERGALSDLMKSAGYSFDIASIDHTRPGDANPNPGQSQGNSDPQQSSSQQGGTHLSSNGTPDRQSSDGQAGARQHRQQGHEQFTERTEPKPDQPAVRPNRTAGGSTVYL